MLSPLLLLCCLYSSSQSDSHFLLRRSPLTTLPFCLIFISPFSYPRITNTPCPILFSPPMLLSSSLLLHLFLSLFSPHKYSFLFPTYLFSKFIPPSLLSSLCPHCPCYIALPTSPEIYPPSVSYPPTFTLSLPCCSYISFAFSFIPPSFC